MRPLGLRQFGEEEDVVPFSRLCSARVSKYDVLNEIPFLGPELRPFLLDGKKITRARELFQMIGDFVRDVDSDRKITHRGNRSGKKLETVVERRVAAADVYGFWLDIWLTTCGRCPGSWTFSSSAREIFRMRNTSSVICDSK